MENLNEIIDEICSMEKISIALLQRKFCISFPKGAQIVDDLIEKNIVEKLDVGYKVLNNKKLSEFLFNLFQE